MPNAKIGTTWAPDIRPGSIETFTENFTPEGGETQTATYKIVPSHPILDKVLDKMAWFRTHAGAVWYNKLAGLTLLQKIKNMEEGIAIPRDADVDEYTTPGRYYVAGSVITETISGIPASIQTGFSLEVKEIGPNVMQEIVPLNGVHYTRGKTSSGWNNWKCLNQTLSYKDVTIGSMSIPSDKGYIKIPGTYSGLFATVSTWGSNSNAFTVTLVSATSELFLIGTPGAVVSSLSVRIWNYET